VSARPAFSCLWLNNGEFVTGDDLRIERVRLSGQKSLICLSTAAEYGFEEKGNRIFIKNNGSWFVSDGRSPWAEIAKAGTAKAEAAQAGTAIPPVRKPSLVSGRYRVYLERQISGPYENIPMIRNTASVGTVPLLPGTRLRGGSRGWETAVPSQNISLAGKSAEAGPGPAGIFTHGLRQGLREVAVCFDLYDDATGLPQILDALNRFGVRATFFLNGEFIRRYPAAVRDIADAGHEAASLFFAPIDLSDARYRVGTDFITRGLARNEDEFYQASGSEIDLLWHAPYFNASSENAAAALKAGYLTVGRDVDPMDWVSRDEAKRLGINQYSAGDMIERIMAQKQPGSIIPVRLGLLPGGRSDYLFLRIDVLLDALVRSGYSVVPVSTIIEHAR
jgi:peptidoglycan/xylan/chitin deacetylase (PgdA/CDA1 family)